MKGADMKKVTFLAATAAAAALIASPVVAQTAAKPASNVQAKSDSVKSDSVKSGKTVKHSRATKHMRKHHARASMRGDMRSGYVGHRYDNAAAYHGRYEQRGTGFWPADVVGGAVGAGAAIATTAVGTAGAIATAPFGGPYRDAYAYDHSYGYGPGYDVAYDYKGTVIPYSANYAARNGFVCQPGTMVTYPNGTRTICQ
jgi:hypothetical protein